MANFTHGQPVTISGTIANIYDHSGEVIVRLDDGQAVLTNVGNVQSAPTQTSKVIKIEAEPASNDALKVVVETAEPKATKAKGK